ncbi:hypothetical protein AI2715V1_3450 [Escherichia coli]|nr:hypothetical protein AI2715V1_3450 [Escherichia coli]CAH3620556.1 hypothetical protein AI2715V1_3450 [Escherichia coli]
MHSWKKKLVVSQLALACTLAITSQANAANYDTWGYHDNTTTDLVWPYDTDNDGIADAGGMDPMGSDGNYVTYNGFVYYNNANGDFDTVFKGDTVNGGFAPIFPDICYHLTHYKPAAADIPVASDNPAHYADTIRYNARTPLQGSLLPLTRLVWA